MLRAAAWEISWPADPAAERRSACGAQAAEWGADRGEEAPNRQAIGVARRLHARRPDDREGLMTKNATVSSLQLVASDPFAALLDEHLEDWAESERRSLCAGREPPGRGDSPLASQLAHLGSPGAALARGPRRRPVLYDQGHPPRRPARTFDGAVSEHAARQRSQYPADRRRRGPAAARAPSARGRSFIAERALAGEILGGRQLRAGCGRRHGQHQDARACAMPKG